MSDAYIKSLEDQNEELRQKLASLETHYANNFKLLVKVNTTDKFKPERQIVLFAMVRVNGGTGETGSQIALVDIATATEKHKEWNVAHYNRCVIYSIKKSALTTDDFVIRAMMRQAGYEQFEYKVV
jgi:hypothetical protein